jgi:ATP-dependent RNA helicase DeaD
MNTFHSLNLPAPLQEALARMQYEQPTEIQAKAIPVALLGTDVLGSAQTGTGKTAAFGIPLVAKLIEDPTASALILTPTRELAEQVMQVLHQLLNKTPQIKTALLIGGVAISQQFIRLKANPRVIVGTPGRINDHLDRRSLSLKSTKILVLDEADRMLDMGFGVQLEEIAKFLPPIRQTFMFSATMPKRIMALSEKFLNNPERIKVGATHAPLAKIKQEVIRVSEDSKYESLLKEIANRVGSILIFAKTKRRVDLLAQKLNQKMGTGAMHGDLRQHQRTRVLREFRDQKYRILVATDVAARGLDIPHIEHVINYDLPQAPEDYIHRIGRTARGESAQGSSLCFISREEEKYWRAIERLLGGDESGPCMQRAPSRGQNNSAPRRGGDSRFRGEARGSSAGAPQRKGRFGDAPSSHSRSRSSDAKPGRSRFSDSGSAQPGRSRFSDSGSAQPAHNRGRFSDAQPGRGRSSDSGSAQPANNRGRFSDAKPGRSRFSDSGSAQPANNRGRFSDAQPGRSRFSDSKSAQPADNRGRFSDAKPGRSRFSDGGAAPANNRGRFSDAQPGRSRFADSGSAQPANSRGRFSDAKPARSRFSDGGAAPSNNRGRFSDAKGSVNPRARTDSRSDSRPARVTTGKPYGPQNRPVRRKPEEDTRASAV